ncbi:3-keto-disaccharide hydrolase [Caulobacter sp. DWR2-3-1b2]|uniref:3-keto-disaccharide hydrolase n=1 Tax=unclassified Caulobacter TaxID=2648921 RepID=UPI003CEF5D9F
MLKTLAVAPILAMALVATTPDLALALARPPLKLVEVPKAAGPAVSLFNGKDLTDWNAWLGYRDPGLTYKDPPVAPIGATVESAEIFKVVQEDGRPALYVNGKTWGSLVHKGDFRDYHLRLQYKWGKGRWAPRETQAPNNGLLYHSHGAPGAVFGTWSRSMEFEIMLGSVGMVVRVGDPVSATVKAVDDPSLIEPKLRFSPTGRDVAVVTPNWNVEAASDAEKPPGQWNTLDLYVLGDSAIHVVNGVPVMEVRDIRAEGQPLTHGAIQLQSEGAETFFRDIALEPITALPKIVGN